VKTTKEYRTKHKEQKWNDLLQLMIDAAEEEKEGTDDKQDTSAKMNSWKISTTGKYQYFAKNGLVLGVTQCTL
jgi:hypothetical protein